MEQREQRSPGLIDLTWPERVRRRHSPPLRGRPLVSRRPRLGLPSGSARMRLMKLAALPMPYLGMPSRFPAEGIGVHGVSEANPGPAESAVQPGRAGRGVAGQSAGGGPTDFSSMRAPAIGDVALLSELSRRRDVGSLLPRGRSGLVGETAAPGWTVGKREALPVLARQRGHSPLRSAGAAGSSPRVTGGEVAEGKRGVRPRGDWSSDTGSAPTCPTPGLRAPSPSEEAPPVARALSLGPDAVHLGRQSDRVRPHPLAMRPHHHGASRPLVPIDLPVPSSPGQSPGRPGPSRLQRKDLAGSTHSEPPAPHAETRRTRGDLGATPLPPFPVVGMSATQAVGAESSSGSSRPEPVEGRAAFVSRGSRVSGTRGAGERAGEGDLPTRQAMGRADSPLSGVGGRAPLTRWLEGRRSLAGRVPLWLRPEVPLVMSIRRRVANAVTLGAVQLPGMAKTVVGGSGISASGVFPGASHRINMRDSAPGFGGDPESHRIPPYQVQGRLDQARNDESDMFSIRRQPSHTASGEAPGRVWPSPDEASDLDEGMSRGGAPSKRSVGDRGEPTPPILDPSIVERRPSTAAGGTFPGRGGWSTRLPDLMLAAVRSSRTGEPDGEALSRQAGSVPRLEMPLFTAGQAGSLRDAPYSRGMGDRGGIGTGEMLLRQITAPPGTESEAPPAPPGGEGPAEPSRPDSFDLERLAREVYAIIEQRLTLERESQDL